MYNNYEPSLKNISIDRLIFNNFSNIENIEEYTFKNYFKEGFIKIRVRYFTGESVEKTIYESGMVDTNIFTPDYAKPFNPKDREDLEIKILQLARAGYKQQDIARKLWVSQPTVSRIISAQKNKNLLEIEIDRKEMMRYKEPIKLFSKKIKDENNL